MAGWYAEVEFVAELDPDHLADHEVDAFMRYYDSNERLLRISSHPLDAADYDQAVGQAAAWVRRLQATELTWISGLSAPIRLVVETESARSRGWSLLGASEAAARLGVSPTRLRQLEESDPAFPKPVDRLAGGKIYRADEVDTYRATRRHGRPGRPRKAAADA